MKTEELRELDAEELGGRLKGARRELYELRFKLAVGQLDNHREIRKARKEIARILTVVHQRRLEAVDGESLVSPRDVQEPAQVAEGRDAEAAAEADEPASPSAAAELETEEAEGPATPANAGSAAGELRPSEDAVEETDAEAGRAKRRRSRKAVNEDEG
jgi:large subunit ribosomal protein L29